MLGVVDRDGEPWILYQEQLAPGGPAVIRLVRPDGTDDHPLLAAELRDLDQGHPAWSPDGQRIAFDVTVPAEPQPAHDLWIADAGGSEARQVATCDARPCLQLAYPAFSPDGTRLALMRYDVHPDGNWGASHVEVLDLATSTRTVVAESDDGMTGYYVPRWSPDGRRIVLVVETYPDETESTTTSRRLAVVEVGDGVAEPVLITPDTFAAGEPDWAPGDRIVFTRSTTPDDIVETGSIATIAPDGDDLRAVTLDGGGDGIEPTWLGDGRLMYVGIADRQMRVVTAYADGSSRVVADWALRGPAGNIVRTHAHLRPTSP